MGNWSELQKSIRNFPVITDNLWELQRIKANLDELQRTMGNLEELQRIMSNFPVIVDNFLVIMGNLGELKGLWVI